MRASGPLVMLSLRVLDSKRDQFVHEVMVDSPAQILNWQKWYHRLHRSPYCGRTATLEGNAPGISADPRQAAEASLHLLHLVGPALAPQKGTHAAPPDEDRRH